MDYSVFRAEGISFQLTGETNTTLYILVVFSFLQTSNFSITLNVGHMYGALNIDEKN